MLYQRFVEGNLKLSNIDLSILAFCLSTLAMVHFYQTTCNNLHETIPKTSDFLFSVVVENKNRIGYKYEYEYE